MTVDRSAAEVTHEALYQQWPRLRAWLDEDRSGRDIQRRLIATSREWDERGREVSDLLRGARLVATADWADANDPDLNELEREFLVASRVAQDEQDALERNRTRSVLRANRRLRFAIVGLVALLVVSLGAGGFAITESQAAARQARAATAARLGASALVVDNLDRELLLAAAAYRADASLDTRGALLAALTRSPTTTGIIRGQPNERLLDVAVSPDGRLVAIGANSGTIAVWDWQRRERVALIRTDQPAFTIAFSSDGGSVYAAQSWPNGWHLRRWSIATATELPDTLVQGSAIENGSIDSVVFAKAAPTAAAFSADGRVSLVYLDGGESRVLTTQVTDGYPGTLAISADGQLVAVASEKEVNLVDAGGATVGSFDLESSGIALPITKMAFSPDAKHLALAADDGSVHLIDPVAGIEIGRANMHTQTVKDVAFTPDGELIMSVADDGVVARWYPDFGHIERFARGHTGRPFAIAVAPDGPDCILRSG